MLSAQRPSELGDIHLVGLLRRASRVLTPERVDQTVTRDDTARVEEEDGEQRPPFAGPDLDHAPVVEHLQRTQNANSISSQVTLAPYSGREKIGFADSIPGVTSPLKPPPRPLRYGDRTR